MSFKSIVVVLLFAFILNANGLRNFFLGKHFKKELLRDGKIQRAARLETFNQTLDHFDPTNTALWDQRYLAADGNGTIAFLMIEGEGRMADTFRTGLWMSLAEEVGAWTFQLEHRFYGGSQPFNNLSTDSLKYLSSDQALADTANFIAAMNEKHQLNNATWVAFGGSYSGALAAWVRYKYPHLVHAAVSSSGPVKAILDFDEYLEVVVGDYANEGQWCKEAISAAFSQIQEAIAENDTATVKEQMKLCEEFTQELAEEPLESANFYGALTDSLALVAQYNGLLGVSVSDICDIMGSEELGGELIRYGKVMETLLPSLTDGDCIDFKYNQTVEELKDDSLEGDAGSSGSRQWIYQTCTEFGYYQTSDSTNDTFGDTVILDLFTKMCADVYGDAFNEDFIVRSINNTNILKGSTNIEVTNVVFVHGSGDPWHKLGIIESSQRAGPAILINGTSHCNDMYGPEVIDSEALQDARESIRNYVLEWLDN